MWCFLRHHLCLQRGCRQDFEEVLLLAVACLSCSQERLLHLLQAETGMIHHWRQLVVLVRMRPFLGEVETSVITYKIEG